MWSRRRFLRRDSELDAALRARTPEARDEFVQSVSQRIEDERPKPRVAWSRLAFAGAVSTLILGSFASFGGIEYAVSGANSTYQLAKELAVDNQVSVESSAQAQYPTPPEDEVTGAGGEGEAQALGDEAENLPFTGVSLLATVLAGFALLGTGIFLRRRERRQE